METNIWLWIGFVGFILAALAVDLGVFQRKAHAVSIKEGSVWTGIWIGLALLFNLGLFLWKGRDTGLEFLTGYLIEKALSLDNIFVFVVIFNFFGVPDKYQHRVLVWGIIGALVMRGILIGIGTTLIEKVHGIIYVFGLFLLYAGVKLALKQETTSVEPARNPVVRGMRKILPVTEDLHGQRFLARRDGQWMATPLLVVLVLIETTDLVFALDSIPAIIAVTQDAFIVFTSNVFAILGLRALYFVLKGVTRKFRYLKVGLGLVLAFAGVKMLLQDIYHIPILVALSVILGLITLSILASLKLPGSSRDESEPAEAEQGRG